jgi:rhodanese-related sulfurtransferase
MMPAEITPSELAKLLHDRQPVHLLDVRHPAEHELVALPDSQLVPLPDLPTRWQEVQPGNATLVVYCHHGVRSWHAAHFLEQQGLADVLSLQGGIDAWSLDVDPSVVRYQ